MYKSKACKYTGEPIITTCTEKDHIILLTNLQQSYKYTHARRLIVCFKRFIKETKVASRCQTNMKYGAILSRVKIISRQSGNWRLNKIKKWREYLVEMRFNLELIRYLNPARQLIARGIEPGKLNV